MQIVSDPHLQPLGGMRVVNLVRCRRTNTHPHSYSKWVVAIVRPRSLTLEIIHTAISKITDCGIPCDRRQPASGVERRQHTLDLRRGANQTLSSHLSAHGRNNCGGGGGGALAR
jgi:hypothetical protein